MNKQLKKVLLYCGLVGTIIVMLFSISIFIYGCHSILTNKKLYKDVGSSIRYIEDAFKEGYDEKNKGE